MFLHSLLDGVTWYPFLFDTPFNAIRAVAIWVTLALVIAYLVCLLYNKSAEFVNISTLLFTIIYIFYLP